ncbi:MAG: hypothetical protein MJZ13_05680 [Bacteroidales bacterium]|nr:hypothetical protein [Bacteroidales bacterium]
MSLFNTVKEKINAIIDWGMGIYNWVFENILGLRFLHTYKEDPDQFIRHISDKYLHLSEEDLVRTYETSPLEVVGQERITSVATSRIRNHGMRVLAVTAMCAWPQSWIMWPLMVVDIIYFQLQVFAISQELYILYKRKGEYSGENQLNYASLANMAVKMAGTQIKHKVIKQAKKVVGQIGKGIVKRSFAIFRATIQATFRQVLKWCGITVTKDMIETTLTLLLSGLCALVGGLISYWLFVPMARRLQRELIEEVDNSKDPNNHI